MLYLGTVPEEVSVGYIGPDQIMTLPYIYENFLTTVIISKIQIPWQGSKIMQGLMSLPN